MCLINAVDNIVHDTLETVNQEHFPFSSGTIS